MQLNKLYTMKIKKGKYLYVLEIIKKERKDKVGKSETYMELQNTYKEIY